MQVYISHASQDRALAKELAKRLSQAGLDVWNPYDEIYPGDNRAKLIGQALEDSDLMLVLITPGAFDSEWLRSEIEYALTSKHYQDRLISVLVGTTFEAIREVPWILQQLPHLEVHTIEAGASAVIKEVQALVQ